MSQEAVERVLGRMITDERFRHQATDALETVSLQEGYCLTLAEVLLLSELEPQFIAELAGRLSPGLCRAGSNTRDMQHHAQRCPNQHSISKGE